MRLATLAARREVARVRMVAAALLIAARLGMDPGELRAKPHRDRDVVELRQIEAIAAFLERVEAGIADRAAEHGEALAGALSAPARVEKPKARGGKAGKATIAVVGEPGPEAIVPTQAEVVELIARAGAGTSGK